MSAIQRCSSFSTARRAVFCAFEAVCEGGVALDTKGNTADTPKMTPRQFTV
jgi:hypothetical protein